MSYGSRPKWAVQSKVYESRRSPSKVKKLRTVHFSQSPNHRISKIEYLVFHVFQKTKSHLALHQFV